jgi:AAA15 family ATPase/GTPase
MKYFTELKLSGYKSIQDVTVKLHPGINIFIGPNGSGKSNLLTFISYLKDEVPDLDSSYFIDIKFRNGDDEFQKSAFQELIPLDIPLFNRKSDLASQAFLSHSIANITNGYSLTKNKSIRIIEPKEHLISNSEIIAELIKNGVRDDVRIAISYIDFLSGSKNDDFLTQPKSLKLEIEEIWASTIKRDVLFATPMGLTLLDLIHNSKNFSRKESEDFFKKSFSKYSKELIDFLSIYSPVRSVRLRDSLSINSKGSVSSIENLQLEFQLLDGWYFWSDLSDGTRRIVSIIYRLVFSDNVVLIEEPELGIHPHQLRKFLDFLKEQAETKQIIISTHSPEVLDVLSSNQLDNINLVSNKKGKTIVKKLNKSQLEKANNYLTETGFLSDYWKYSDLEK